MLCFFIKGAKINQNYRYCAVFGKINILTDVFVVAIITHLEFRYRLNSCLTSVSLTGAALRLCVN